MVYVLCVTSPTSINLNLFEQLLQTTVSASFLQELCREHKVKARQGIYGLAVVIWLMIYQRLDGKKTLSSAVQFLARQAVHWRQGRTVGKRVREGRVSTRTGGYCQARGKLPTLVASNVCDHIFEQLQEQMREQLPEVPRPVFVIDGTTLQLSHERELARAFPPGRNQHGENHWPTILLVTFHDAHTGLATRPSWGPMYGEQPASEQELAREALGRLPEDAIVMGDGNFGIFTVAYAIQQSQRLMLLRLTVSRAQKVLRGEGMRPGRRRKVEWEPSSHERGEHPNLPAGAMVKGWVVACCNPAKKGEMLYFFTTVDLKPRRILALYKLRWNIETDLRSLKRTVELHRVTSKSIAMVEKEVLMAICAYNVVRAVMYLSASKAGLTPRQLSFSTAQDAVMAAWPYLQRTASAAEFQEEVQRLLHVVAQSKLPERSRRRSYTREIWGRGGHFPFRRSPNQEAR
ncbi:MAG TPA: IS4 family transposase [Bryobacterales bacterium]|nr:IS4 family transposase [Bryobacterales bacterium]